MSDMHAHGKRFIFADDAIACRFHHYIELLSETGKVIRAAFVQIDFRRTGRISAEDLRRALVRVDLAVADEDLHKMLSLGSSSAGFDLSDLFHVLGHSFVACLRDCLLEWLSLACTPPMAPGHPPLELRLLPGEVVALRQEERVHWSLFLGPRAGGSCLQVPGQLLVTNFRLLLLALRRPHAASPLHSRFEVPAFFDRLSLPLGCLLRLWQGPPRSSLFLAAKDYRTLRITLSGIEDLRDKSDTLLRLLQALSHLPATPAASPGPQSLHGQQRQLLFSFRYSAPLSSADLGWNLCDISKEFVRQGLFDCPDWRVLDNSSPPQTLCDSYPRYLALPAHMSRAELFTAAQFRSRNRLPALTYRHANGAVLARSAQPLTGLTHRKSVEDELLLGYIRTRGRPAHLDPEAHAHSKLYILDARGKMAATLNMAVGKGTEDVSAYPNTELVFCNIDNIHVMRASAIALAEALATQQQPQHREELQGAGFFQRLEESAWLRHTQLLLLASSLAAEKLHFEAAGVLVHCSDGWDRTAQICSLVQVMLDPHYRTVEGLAALVEKDWCSFGYKFQDRCGHGVDSAVLAEERSPVFLQFLEALFQLLHQFPAAFEYSQELLLFLADHVHSCLFGNFLGNSDCERFASLQVQGSTRSVWAYVLDHRRAFCRTDPPLFRPFPHPIWPQCGMARIKLWERFWLRWDAAAHPSRLSPDGLWRDDWGERTLEEQTPGREEGPEEGELVASV